MSQPTVILIDQREQAPLRFSSAISTETVLLPVGDYSLRGASDIVAIERKRLGELATCCGTDRPRFIEQLERLRSFPVRGLVIEADLNGLLSGAFASRINPLSVLGTLIKAGAEWQIPIWFAGDAKNAAVLVERMMLWVGKHLDNRPWASSLLADSPIAAEVRAVVAHELRSAGLHGAPAQPLKLAPWAQDAEQEICALLLGGYRAPDQLAPLQPEHFYATVFRNIFEAAQAVSARGEVCELGPIAEEFERRGTVGPWLDELRQTRDATPIINGTQLQRRIEEVMECALRRRTIEQLERSARDLRDGQRTSDGTRADIAQFFGEVFG